MQSQSFDINDAEILLIDGDAERAKRLGDGLTSFDNVKVIHSLTDALSVCRVNRPHLVIYDVNLGDVDSRLICRHFREMSLLTRFPIIFLTASDAEETEINGWDSAATTFLRKPASSAALNMLAMSQLTKSWHIEISSRLYRTDSLTGLKNRYFYDKHIVEQTAYATRYRGDVSVLVVEIDKFRDYCRNNGEEQGEKCLHKVAQVLRKNANRAPDIVCRYGSDEFAIILPGTDRSGAQHVGKNLISAIASANIPHISSPEGRVTISVGAASLTTLENENTSLIEKAFKQLDIAKASGDTKVA